MTPAQNRRQDMQVQWLREAIAAQNRAPDDLHLDPESLRLPTRKDHAK